MTKIGLFYGTSTNNTKLAAMAIKKQLESLQPDSVTLINIGSNDLSTLADYERIILGTPTLEYGGLQEDWEYLYPDMDDIDLTGKKVAVFGLGDQQFYPDTFQDGLGILGEKAREQGAELVGFWPTEGYEFMASRAVENGHFIGLALDNDNQSEMTKDRIQTWVAQLIKEFELA